VAGSYPLDAAVLDRQGKRARREAELSAALAALSRVETEVTDAEAGLCAHQARRPGVEQAGRAVGRELRRAAAFARRHALEVERLRGVHHAALARLASARAAVASVRKALGEAYAAEHALERDRERFVIASRKRVRESEQDELDDQLAPRKRPR
jgi:hypothetical protein